MKVPDVEKVLLLFFDPLLLGESLTFRAMPVAAGVIRNPLEPTLVTDVHMSAQSRGPAVKNVAEGSGLNEG